MVEVTVTLSGLFKVLDPSLVRSKLYSETRAEASRKRPMNGVCQLAVEISGKEVSRYRTKMIGSIDI